MGEKRAEKGRKAAPREQKRVLYAKNSPKMRVRMVENRLNSRKKGLKIRYPAKNESS